MSVKNCLNLKLDIKTTEKDCIYGEDGHHFLATSRGVLGVESGVSFSDVGGRARESVNAYLMIHPPS